MLNEVRSFKLEAAALAKSPEDAYLDASSPGARTVSRINNDGSHTFTYLDLVDSRQLASS